VSYQQECEIYALFGNPEQEEMDYELNAEYDRWDGHRVDFPIEDPNDGWMLPYCPAAEYAEMWIAELRKEEDDEQTLHQLWMESIESEVPF